MITKREETVSAITETFYRIHLYAAANNALPPNLSVLPKRATHVNQTVDGWNRQLQYSIDPKGIITLRSLGADGKLGGEGDDADISVSYYSTRPDGTFWPSSPTWIVEGEVIDK
jgi:general secretion pathway protein G